MEHQVFIAEPDTHPRTYRLQPAPAPGRWRGYHFEPAEPFIVHSKLYGSHEKPQPYLVRGVTRGGRLLVQTMAESVTDYHVVGSWHEVECGDTTEGYRFKRRVLKPVAALIRLGKDIAKTNARVEKQRVTQAARVEKCGTCPCCFGDYVVTNKLDSRQFSRFAMVHHGYERPGIGYIVGDCHGVGYEPFEISCEGTKSLRTRLQNVCDLRQDALATLTTRDEIVVERLIRLRHGKHKVETTTLKRGDAGFAAAIETRSDQLKTELESLKRTIAELEQRIATWAPQPWPRKGS